MQRPHLNSTAFVKAGVKAKKYDKAHIECKKACHKGQHFLITAKLLPLLRTNKSFEFLPPEGRLLLSVSFYNNVFNLIRNPCI
jgi:hypothetical protein